MHVHIYVLLLASATEGKIRVEDIVKLGSRAEDADITKGGKV